MSTVSHVGGIYVENHFPDCDALTILPEGGDGGISITVSRQENGDVGVRVQDDHTSATRVFKLGADETFDPHSEA